MPEQRVERAIMAVQWDNHQHLNAELKAPKSNFYQAIQQGVKEEVIDSSQKSMLLKCNQAGNAVKHKK